MKQRFILYRRNNGKFYCEDTVTKKQSSLKTFEEHEKILSRERNDEMNAFIRCCWEIGGSQSDVASLKAEDIDWQNHVVSFFRGKTGTVQTLHFGEHLAQVLRSLPQTGFLFPRLAVMDEKHRASLTGKSFADMQNVFFIYQHTKAYPAKPLKLPDAGYVIGSSA